VHKVSTGSRMLIQAQIGADPRNTLFAYCIKYPPEDIDLFPYIVGAAVGAAALLVIIVIAVYCVHRWRKARDRRPPNLLYSQQELDDDTQAETSFRADLGLQRRDDTQQLPNIPRVVLRPQSIYPDDDEPAPTSRLGRGVVRRQNTLSIYPSNDDEDYSRNIP